MELVQALLEGGDVVPEIAALVLGKAGGNPLFVEELTHSLVENGSIQKKDNRFVLARKSSEIEVPDTIQGIIAARMDRIEDNLKRIMQVASVIGREFAYRILQSITDMSEDLKASLLNLQGLEFVYEKQLFPELEYIFKHALTQEVAYNSLLLKKRKEIHEDIGQAIEGLYSERLEEYYEVLAYHYVRSNNQEKAVAYLELANQKAFRANALEEAKGYFEEAMGILNALRDSEDRRERMISLLANQVSLFNMLLKTAEYYELMVRYEPLAASLRSSGVVGAFCSRLAYCEEMAGLFDQSIQSATKAAELCEAAGNVGGAAYAYMVSEWSNLYRGNLERVLVLNEMVRRKMSEQFNARWYVYGSVVASLASQALGHWDDAVALGQDALNVAQECSDNSLISLVASVISRAYAHKGDLTRAIEYGHLGNEKAPTPADKLWAKGTLAWVRCRAGETDKGTDWSVRGKRVSGVGSPPPRRGRPQKQARRSHTPL